MTPIKSFKKKILFMEPRLGSKFFYIYSVKGRLGQTGFYMTKNTVFCPKNFLRKETDKGRI